MGPTVVGRQLGRRLRQLRDASGMSVDEVVAERYLGISRAKLYELEPGKHAAKPQDITVLLFTRAEWDAFVAGVRAGECRIALRAA